jgi:endonuclease V-like protein UPF0215 family
MMILAIEDGRFPTNRRGKVLLVGVITRNTTLCQVILSKITADGRDATERLLEIIDKSRRKINLILLHSIAYGGFNLIDPVYVYDKRGIPIAIINPERPDPLSVKKALLTHFLDWKTRYALFKKVGPPQEIRFNHDKLYVRGYGLTRAEIKTILQKLIKTGKIPEPLRIARLIAHGISG